MNMSSESAAASKGSLGESLKSLISQQLMRQLTADALNPNITESTFKGFLWKDASPSLPLAAPIISVPPRIGRESYAGKHTKPATRGMVSGSRKDRRLLILVRIILQDLTISNDRASRDKIIWIIRECKKLNRAGDARFRPLRDSVEVLLKGVVGEVRWGGATQRLQSMLLKRRRLLLQQMS